MSYNEALSYYIYMTKLSYPRLIWTGFAVFLILIGILFIVTKQFGNVYKESLNNQAINDVQNESSQDKYDIKRIRYQLEDGSSIEILQNGTLVKLDDQGKKQAIIGFSKLQSLFSSLTEEQLIALQNSNQLDGGATLTIETKSGNTYIINVDSHNPNNVIDDLIDDIIDTADNTFNPPTPAPTPFVGSTPTPTPTQSNLPTPSPLVNFTTPTPSPTSIPGTSPLPAYLTAQPFVCSDYNLSKKAVISNIICEPNP